MDLEWYQGYQGWSEKLAMGNQLSCLMRAQKAAVYNSELAMETLKPFILA